MLSVAERVLHMKVANNLPLTPNAPVSNGHEGATAGAGRLSLMQRLDRIEKLLEADGGGLPNAPDLRTVNLWPVVTGLFRFPNFVLVCAISASLQRRINRALISSLLCFHCAVCGSGEFVDLWTLATLPAPVASELQRRSPLQPFRFLGRAHATINLDKQYDVVDPQIAIVGAVEDDRASMLSSSTSTSSSSASSHVMRHEVRPRVWARFDTVTSVSLFGKESPFDPLGMNMQFASTKLPRVYHS